MDKETLFLTTRQALVAICIDFRQYDPQILLYSEVIRLISDDTIHLKREPQKNGAWVSRRTNANMRWMEGGQLTEFMCRAVMEAQWPKQRLAAVCARVFQTRAAPARHPSTGAPGVCIDTNMADFVCRQCGDCCRSLDYHHGVTAGDMARWEKMGRQDILDRVQLIQPQHGPWQYRIWIDPRSGNLAETCPFLVKAATAHKWTCTIQEIKPWVCRHYPVSRKHALMNRCRGFHKPA